MNTRELDLYTTITYEEPASSEEYLLELGQEKGYVTHEDILDLLPDVENDIEKFESLLNFLLQKNIPYQEEMIDDEVVKTIQSSEIPYQVPVGGADGLDYVDTDDLLTLYFRQAAREPLLTKEEEVMLAKEIEAGEQARKALVVSSGGIQRRETLLETIKAGEAARQRMIMSNSRLVISIAKKYRGRGIPFIDLVQEGNIGLMRAVKKFDYQLGNKFSTYATWWIRQAVTRAIADNGRTVRVPVHMGDLINKMLRLEHQLVQKLGRRPTENELAIALDKPPAKVKDIRQIAMFPVSLETPISHEEDATLGDFIEDQNTPAPDDLVTNNLMNQEIAEALRGIPLREARVLQMRYGLLDGKTYTLQAIGEKMGITRERVRQMEEKGLRQLRKSRMRNLLTEYID
jgi:RNA polymerase primary sigma factor